ncbi:NAD-binding protein [bacterium]|jgi:voltage-gated potassium channel|nr:NAD-binding protein [bacterium]
MSKVIIYGYSNLGMKIASSLKKSRYEIIIVDYDENNYNKAILNGFEAYHKELLVDEELLEIGIENDIKAFYCVSDSSNNNFFVTLSARSLNKNIKIISKASSKQDNKKMLLAGATKVINPYEIGAVRMFRLLEKPIISHVLDKILFGESLLNIEEFSILEGSYLDGKYLKDFDFSKEFNIIVIGLTDKELSDDFILNLYFENHKIDVGDTLVAIGYRENLDKFNKYIRNGH